MGNYCQFTADDTSKKNALRKGRRAELIAVYIDDIRGIFFANLEAASFIRGSRTLR